MFSTISPVSRSQKRAVTAATWGLTSTRGWRQKGWPAGNGSAAKTSRAAPRTREASRTASRAVSSNRVPRDTFTTMASSGSRSSTARLTAPRVSAVCGAVITRQSLSAASRGRSARPPTQRTPFGPPRAGRRRTPATLIPRATPRRAIAPPMPPTPTGPPPETRAGGRDRERSSRSRRSPNRRWARHGPRPSWSARCESPEDAASSERPPLSRCGPSGANLGPLRPRRPAPRVPGRSRRRTPRPPPRVPLGRPMPSAPRPRPPPTPVPTLFGSSRRWSRAPATRRAARRDRRRAAGEASLARGHGPDAGLMEQRQHDLVMQPLGPTQREFDHEVHVFATARLPLQLVQDGGAGVGMHRQHAPRGLPRHQALDASESPQDDQDEQRRNGRFRVERRAQRHPDGRDDPDRGRAREADHRTARVQDRARADEPHTGHDLCGDARRVGVSGGHRERELGVEHRADADEDVGPETGRLAAQLALETDGAAEQGRETQLAEQLQPEHVHHMLQEVLHQAPLPSAPSRNPIRRRTWLMVRRAMARALAAPARSRSVTLRGSAWSACARSRMGVSAAIILSVSTRLQSRQPHPAVRQLCATSLSVSGGEKPW